MNIYNTHMNITCRSSVARVLCLSDKPHGKPIEIHSTVLLFQGNYAVELVSECQLPECLYTPKISTHKISTHKISTPKMLLPECQLPECQLPECQLLKCQLPKYQLP